LTEDQPRILLAQARPYGVEKPPTGSAVKGIAIRGKEMRRIWEITAKKGSVTLILGANIRIIPVIALYFKNRFEKNQGDEIACN